VIVSSLASKIDQQLNTARQKQYQGVEQRKKSVEKKDDIASLAQIQNFYTFD